MALDDMYVRTLTKSRVMIRDKMINVCDLLDHLKAQDIITDEHISDIKAEKTPQDRTRRTLDILVKCSPKEKVFNAFCDALGAEEYEDIRDILRQEFEKLKNETNFTPLIAFSGHETARPAQVSSTDGRFSQKCSLIL